MTDPASPAAVTEDRIAEIENVAALLRRTWTGGGSDPVADVLERAATLIRAQASALAEAYERAAKEVESFITHMEKSSTRTVLKIAADAVRALIEEPAMSYDHDCAGKHICPTCGGPSIATLPPSDSRTGGVDG